MCLHIIKQDCRLTQIDFEAEGAQLKTNILESLSISARRKLPDHVINAGSEQGIDNTKKTQTRVMARNLMFAILSGPISRTAAT